MKITRGALMRIVKGARAADRLAFDMRKLMMDSKGMSVADYISGQLDDALFVLSGEKLTSHQDFVRDSMTMKLIRDNKLADWEVTEQFMKMADFNAEEMPKPCTFERDEMKKLVRENGGYLAKESPEGEFISHDPIQTIRELSAELLRVNAELLRAKQELRNCGNELCLQCGLYHRSHEGVCDDCRWKKVKSGEMPT